jgi:3-oxo-5-alpha-steroid 4-dehydrogenase 1
MTEPALHRAVVLGILATAVPTWLALRYVSAPYGRHTRDGWGPTLPARLGWMLMESPASLVWLGIYLVGANAFAPAPLVMLALWQLHYVNRAFLLPLRAKPDDKRVPALVPALAVAFNLANAYTNARHVSHLGAYATSWLWDPRFLVGALLFLGGRTLNVRADEALLALRNEGRGYQIPRGPYFRWISCPNYAAEILEWCGWAILTWSLAGVAFAVYTFANLAPRALSHHRWYQEKFPDYPRERRALLPGIW